MSFQPRSIRKKSTVSTPSTPTPSTLIPDTIESDPTTTSTSTTTPSVSSCLLPRAIAKRTKVLPPAPTPAPATITTHDTSPPIASTSTLLDNVKLDPTESVRLESILTALEGCLCDWGLSSHRSTGMLEKLRDSQDGYIHIQYVLQNAPPVSAIAKSQSDVQKALRSRESRLLEISPDGFKVRRRAAADYDALSKLNREDWQGMTLYLENLPSVPGVIQTTHTLQDHLSSLLSTSIQTIILPPVFDPAHPTPTSLGNTGPSTTNSSMTTQNEAFTTGKRKGKGVALPVGGGPFKGFSFIIVARKEDAEKALKRWKWERVEGEDNSLGEDKMEVVSEKVESDYEKLAIESGMRALSYTTFLELKNEYLGYQRSLNILESHPELRNLPTTTTSTSYHNHSHQNNHPSSPSSINVNSTDSHLASNRKRDRPDHSHQSDLGPSSSKKIKRGRSTSPNNESEEPFEVNPIDIVGAFPKGCVLWIRNVFEKSTRGGLKTLLSSVLEELEEGSGKNGVQYVDYEKKGMDTCHARFLSPHFCNLIFNHFTSTEYYHLSSNLLSSTPPSDSTSIKPISIQLLTGTREVLYWENLPESTRREARKYRGVEVAIVDKLKTKKKRKSESAGIGGLLEEEREELELDLLEKEVLEEMVEKEAELEKKVVVEEGAVKPRKKPSRF